MNMGSSSPGSGSSSSSSHGAMSMPMVFTTGHTTPLYSTTWTPWNTSGYAGTCIFLIFLAVISRLLYVWRRQLELKWLDGFVNRRYVMVAGHGDAERNAPSHPSEKSEEATLTARGVDERVRVLLAARAGAEIMPWSFGVDLPRACVFTVQAGVGYLL